MSVVEPFSCAWVLFLDGQGHRSCVVCCPPSVQINNQGMGKWPLDPFTKACRDLDLYLTCKVEGRFCYKTHLHAHRDAQRDHGKRGTPNNTLLADFQEPSAPHISAEQKK